METVHPLRAFRDEQKPRLTQRELAALLGVRRTTVARWETKARKIDRERLLKVSEVTGIAPALLRPDLAELMKEPEAAQ